MKVPFLDLKSQYASIKRDEVDPAIQNVLDNTAYVMGKPVFDFEEKFAEAHNVKHCIGTSSGTDANHLVPWALGIGPGDEVIIPANTFIATAWGATLCGATPVFVDVDPETYNIDPVAVQKAITPKTKAIVAVHLYGQPADMDSLRHRHSSLATTLMWWKTRHKPISPNIKESASADWVLPPHLVFIPVKIWVPMAKAAQLRPMMMPWPKR